MPRDAAAYEEALSCLTIINGIRSEVGTLAVQRWRAAKDRLFLPDRDITQALAAIDEALGDLFHDAKTGAIRTKEEWERADRMDAMDGWRTL